MTGPPRVLARRALRVEQSATTPIYLFCLTPDELWEVADISRIARDTRGELIGYQRPEVKRHVDDIVTYLDSDHVIFPNAIIIALPPAVRFRSSRGPNVSDGLAATGTLEISIPASGDPRPGWIVDGQQRALALARSRRQNLPVPVTAFIADTVELQRDQFLRINNVQPLPRGLVTELLPDVWTSLSPRLSARKIPSALCDLLNRQEASPFVGLIRRASSRDDERRRAVVTDTSVIAAIEESFTSPSGVLFPYRNLATGETDIDGIWALLLCYWRAVASTFPDAWGKPATESRLMHGVGIRAVGRLMDRVMASAQPRRGDAVDVAAAELARIAPYCRWTDGRWDEIDIAWNELQNIPRHIRMLSNYLVRRYLQERQGVS